jgi:hypothetical protein
MKTTTFTIVLLFMMMSINLSAQGKFQTAERHGGTLNLGLGIGGYSGYYGYIGHSLPVFNINYEFGVARNFTLAPFLTLYSYSDNNYSTIVTPIGVKGTLYFDQLLRAGSRWDFYGAGSLGFSLVSTRWHDDYDGDRNYYRRANPLYLDLHLGTEFHVTNRIGLFLDLSTGVSTIGIAFH